MRAAFAVTVVAVLFVFCHATFSRSQWQNLPQKLKDLDDDHFFGMSFVTNITGKRCIPQWHFPKPKCWGHGWPWPWPQPPKGTTTTKKPTSTTKKGGDAKTSTSTTGRTSTGRTSTTSRASTTTVDRTSTTTIGRTSTTTLGGQPTTTQGQNNPTSLPTSTVVQTSTSTATQTSTSTANTPTTPSGNLETTTCQYALDIQDDAFCKDIRGVVQGEGELQQCKPYYDNATVMQFYDECRQFQCKYQRAYRCYGMLPFIYNCSAQLPEDESLYGWRYYNHCPKSSSPFPSITFTDIPTTTAGTAAGRKKRHAKGGPKDEIDEDNSRGGGKEEYGGKGGKPDEDNGSDNKSNGWDDHSWGGDKDDDWNNTHEDDSSEETDEGTNQPAEGIKWNWCVPRIFSWWHKHGAFNPKPQPHKPNKPRRRRGGRWRKGKKNGKGGRN